MELAEETGLRAGRLEHLGLALGLRHGLLQPTRQASGARPTSPRARWSPNRRNRGSSPAPLSLAEVDRMVRENEIKDAASVAAWHLAAPRRP